MIGTIKRFFILCVVGVVILLVILITQTFFIFKNYQTGRQDLELRFGKEEARKKKLEQIEKDEEQQRKLREAQYDNELNKKFNTRDKYKILKRENVSHSGFFKRTRKHNLWFTRRKKRNFNLCSGHKRPFFKNNEWYNGGKKEP